MKNKTYRFAAVAAVLLMLLVFTAPVAAEYIYVGPDQIYTTLTAAVDDANPGDTIILKEGRHQGVCKQIGTKGLVIKGEPGAQYILNTITGPTGPGFSISADDVVISDLTIIVEEQVTGNPVFALAANNLTIERCTVTAENGGLYFIDGAIGDYKITVSDTTFKNLGSDAMYTVYAGTHYSEHTKLLTFTGNTIEGAFDAGIDAITGNYVISDNTFDISGGYAIGITVHAKESVTSKTKTISKNTFKTGVINAVRIQPFSTGEDQVEMFAEEIPVISNDNVLNSNGPLLEVSLLNTVHGYHFAEIPVITPYDVIYSYGSGETYGVIGEFDVSKEIPLVPGVNLPGSSWSGDAENGYTLKITKSGTYKLTDSFKCASVITFDEEVDEFTLDGSGYCITQAECCTNSFALLDVPAHIDVINLKNVTFDGIKGGAVIRTVGNDITIDNCVFQNCEHTQIQGLLRLTQGNANVINSKFIGNTCTMALTFNYDAGDASKTLHVDNCLFKENTCAGTAVLYYVTGAACEITNTQFVDNTVNCAGNGATVYLGFTENNVVTGNLFKGNEVTDSSTSTRVAGGIFFGYEADVSGNAFVGNSAANANGDALGQDVCVSTYYTDIDLSANYFDGEEPVENEEYFVQHKDRDGHKVILKSYYTTCKLNEDGTFALSGLVAGKDCSSSVTADVAKIGFDSVKVGYTQPEAKTVTVTNAGDAKVTITASIASGNYDVKVTKEDAVSDALATLTIQPKAGLAVGNYEDTLTITIAETGKTITIPVSFLVYQPSSGGSTKPVEEPEEPVVEPETPADEPEAGEVTVETEVTDGGEIEFEAPVEEPEAGEGSAPAAEDEAKITGVVLPAGTEGKVEFIPVSEKPAPAGKETQTKKVFEINVPQYEKGKPATVKFTMTVAELAADGKTAAEVALWHFDEETGEWTKLVTSYTIVDGVVYFEAITYDFSPFAIIYEDAVEQPEQPVEEPETPASPAPVLGVLAALGAAVVLRRK